MPQQVSDLLKSKEAKDLGLILAAVFGVPPEPSLEKLLERYLKCLKGSLVFAKKVPLQEKTLPRFPPLVVNIGGRVRIGGGGIVMQCEHAEVRGLQYALKITRPSLFEDAEASGEEYDQTIAEYVKHAPLSHQNLVRVIFGEPLYIPRETKGQAYDCPTMLMEWINDPMPLSSYLFTRVHDSLALAHLLAQCFDGVDYLHRNGLVHWDLKSDNILVDQQGTVKITDLGNSEPISSVSKRVQTSPWNLPPELRTQIPKLPVEHRVDTTWRRVTIKITDKRWHCPGTDMWMLAKELDRLLAIDPVSFQSDERLIPGFSVENVRKFRESCFPLNNVDSQFAFKFFRLVIERLLLPEKPWSGAYYNQAWDVARDLRKLEPEFGAAQNVRELQAIPQAVLRLPQSGNVPFTSRVDSLFNSNLIQRLSRHRQLATVAHVYPGATHCRSEHVAGVVACVAEFVRALYADRTNPFWRIVIESEDIDALLVAALLHDIGHIAYGHFLEELDGVFKGRTHEDYFICLLAPRRNLEARFRHGVQDTIKADRHLLIKLLVTNWNIPESRVADFLELVADVLSPVENKYSTAIFQADAQYLPEPTRTLKIQILHSIIVSAIDADKLDYLMRDAHHAGVSYGGGIDLDRFFQSVTTIPHLQRLRREVGVTASIGVTSKGILPVESILLARYQLFSAVYWHRTTRAETAMLQFLVQQFISAAKTEDARAMRLEQMIEAFRCLDDIKALEWLGDRLELTAKHIPTERRALLESVVNALLGNRECLYWPVFELQYHGGKKDPESLYRGLAALIDEISKKKSLGAVLVQAKKVRKELGNQLAKAASDLNRKAPLSFTDGEVLLDCPPAGRDQIENIFVWAEEGILEIQQLSPVADAIKNAFRYWVRRPRVFLAPRAWARCRNANLDLLQLKEKFYTKLEPQLSLPFPKQV